MPTDSLLDDLHRRWKKIALLESNLNLLGWDEQVCLPPAGQAWRGEQSALVAGLIHEELCHPGLAETLNRLESSVPGDPFNQASVKEARRRQQRAQKIPTRLVEELARVCSQSQPVWANARKNSDYRQFLPFLEKIIHLKKEEAAAVGWQDHPYNSLLDEYEPGMDCAQLDGLFDELQKPLSNLVAQTAEKGSTAPTQPVGRFDLEAQKLLAEAAAKALGFRFDSGRLDTSTHPFCSGIAPGDCRLTTRYQPDTFLESFFGVLHETGHGLYEQGMPEACRAEPWCQAASLGIHESQSRLWENMVGRTRSFWEYFLPIAKAVFGSELDGWSLERLTGCLHRTRRSFIRVEADETTYNLHIILRYRLEKALIDGTLSAVDLPHAWNSLFEELFGMSVPDDRQGCLQDIHWSGGGFGYFPTYTLGNLYAAQLMRAARKELGDLDSDFRQGIFARLLSWLRDKVHRIGRSKTAQEICKAATGSQLSALPLLEHLRHQKA